VVDTAAIGGAVVRAITEASSRLRPDVRRALENAARGESSPTARAVLAQLLENDRIASRDQVPVCQDTGSVWVSIELGSDERIGGDLEAVVNSAVADAYESGGLRMSMVADALCDRTNTGDNTPAFLDVKMRPGAGATVDVMLKGGGSDNCSALAMLAPAAGVEGVTDFVVETVLAKATGACPPVVIGVGVGGTFDTVAKLSKQALLRPLDGQGQACVADLEREILERVNDSGIGPAGWGGDTTALAAHVLTAPCHIAALPVAVNVGCCALRSARVELA
jgi:tartrate/fumarate subfamily iron-sulfur-dependent hydro-lyase alpha chain